MYLNGFGAGTLIGIVQVFEKLGLNYVACIEHYYCIVYLELWKIQNGVLERFGFRADFEVGRQQRDGALGQVQIGHLRLVVGDDDYVEKTLRVGLSVNGVDGMQDAFIALVGRDEHDEAVLMLGLGQFGWAAE